MASLNACAFIGNLGADPEVKSFSNGGKVCNLRLAVSESWKDRDGNKQERTTWVPVSIFSEGLVGVAERYLRKGSKIYISGAFSVREYEKNGEKRYATEIILRGFDAKLVMLDGKSDGPRDSGGGSHTQHFGKQTAPADDLDDEIPF
jgi:single-strand DNA-binding protein